jgi:uncharacterized protein YgbK (DUF1537 family)
MLIGAIADDLTGATDLGLMFARGGLSVVQCVGVPKSGAELDDAQAVIVALKSRTVPAAEAVALSLRALSFLREQGAAQYFFKYCSTFDSTDGGNIGPVTDALLDALGETRTIACPAMPDNGRTVYQGHLFVGSSLLSESSMKDHPLTPMRDSNLVRLLERQSRRPISLISYATLRSQRQLNEAFASIDGIAVVDALSQHHLTEIGRAARDLRLVTGASGLGQGLAESYLAEVKHNKSRAIRPAPGGAVVLAGSCSAATRRQLGVAAAAGAPLLKLNALAVAAGEISPLRAADFATDAAGPLAPVIYSSADAAEVEAAQKVLGRDEAGTMMEHFLAEVARELLGRGVTRFIVAGGETSGAVTLGLGATMLRIGPEIDPGVPWTSFRHGERTIALALKSGNFGADDFLLKAWDLLE